MSDLTSVIVNTASALSEQRVQAAQSVIVFDKALEAQRTMALTLIQTVASPPPSGGGNQIDLVA